LNTTKEEKNVCGIRACSIEYYKRIQRTFDFPQRSWYLVSASMLTFETKSSYSFPLRKNINIKRMIHNITDRISFRAYSIKEKLQDQLCTTMVKSIC
jgi:hypothetical protein